MPSCKPPPFDELNPRWSMNLEPINYFEPTNSAEMLARRKESARHTLRTASPEELHALVEELFPDGTHPWAATFSQFIDEHRSERAIRVKRRTLSPSSTTRGPTWACGVNAPAAPSKAMTLSYSLGLTSAPYSLGSNSPVVRSRLQPGLKTKIQ